MPGSAVPKMSTPTSVLAGTFDVVRFHVVLTTGRLLKPSASAGVSPPSSSRLVVADRSVLPGSMLGPPGE
ncbi:MAG: hypothetical protein ACK533_08750 [Planctomycetota bacterium]